MAPNHPFKCLTPKSRKQIFFILLIITLATMAALRSYDTHLKADAAPNGILSYEFAGNLPAAQNMIKSWGEKGQIYAGLSLGIDYLFLTVYSLTIGLGCVMIGESLSIKFSKAESIAAILAWGLIIAAILDAIENYALIQLLLGSANESWPTIAWICAAPKFVLVGFGLLYLIIGTIVIIFTKKQSTI
jgi:hypothetical protein